MDADDVVKQLLLVSGLVKVYNLNGYTCLFNAFTDNPINYALNLKHMKYFNT